MTRASPVRRRSAFARMRAAGGWAARRQAAPVEVGAGPIGERSLALVGRSAYGGDTVRLYGYLSGAIGIDRADLFADPGASSAATARFTYAGEVAVADRATRGDLTTITGSGTLAVFLNEAGGDWARPESFAAGTRVAAFAIELSDMLQRQSPELGGVVGDAALRQTAAETFDLAGETVRFGHVGAVYRFRTVGALLPGTAEPLTVGLTGSTVVTERNLPSPVVRDPSPATPVPAGRCPALEPWLCVTRDRLAEGRAVVAALVVAAGEPPSPGDLDEALAAIEQATTEQRQATVPDAGAEADRLAVAALSTWARGVRLLAGASANGDATELDAGRAVLADGNGLANRAEEVLARLEAECP